MTNAAIDQALTGQKLIAREATAHAAKVAEAEADAQAVVAQTANLQRRKAAMAVVAASLAARAARQAKPTKRPVI